MNYPELPDFKSIYWDIVYYGNMKAERGATGFSEKLKKTEDELLDIFAEVRAMAEDPELRKKEPDDIEMIRSEFIARFLILVLFFPAVYISG